MDSEIISFSALGVNVMVSRIFLMGLKVFSAIAETWTLVHDLLVDFALISLVTFVRMFDPESLAPPFYSGNQLLDWRLDRIELRARNVVFVRSSNFRD